LQPGPANVCTAMVSFTIPTMGQEDLNSTAAAVVAAVLSGVGPGSTSITSGSEYSSSSSSSGGRGLVPFTTGSTPSSQTNFGVHAAPLVELSAPADKINVANAIAISGIGGTVAACPDPGNSASTAIVSTAHNKRTHRVSLRQAFLSLEFKKLQDRQLSRLPAGVELYEWHAHVVPNSTQTHAHTHIHVAAAINMPVSPIADLSRKGGVTGSQQFLQIPDSRPQGQPRRTTGSCVCIVT
jgi:hypothetical protein